MKRLCLLLGLILFPGWCAAKDPSDGGKSWTFAVSGDSRDAGDVVMPAVARGVRSHGAAFYWHLGDFRHISDFDQDILHQPEHRKSPMSIASYLDNAWDDFIDNQLAPFADTPVYLSIGNHEVTSPRTRAEYVQQFADWLGQPTLTAQRLRDDPKDHRLKTWYHWQQGHVDFISLDNASSEQFDAVQLKWFEAVLQRDSTDANIQSVVVGAHEALPDSLSSSHSMGTSPTGVDSGRRVYADLLKAQNESHKKVYVLASHSHYYMEGIFNTEHWRSNGGILPGWIVGTAGASRFPLPADASAATDARARTYGYLLATVHPTGDIGFTFEEVHEADIPAAIVTRYTPEFVHWCFAENAQESVPWDPH